MSSRNHPTASRSPRTGAPPRTAQPRRSAPKLRSVAAPTTRSPYRPRSAPRVRHRGWWTAIPIAVVVLVVVTFLVLAPGSGSSPGTSSLSVGSAARPGGPAIGIGAVAAPAAVQAALSSVHPATLHTVGVPGGLIGPTKVNGSPAPLVGADGKPEVLYVGAEYCPFCAAQRWSLAVALSHFGAFAGLKTTHSSLSDIYPDTKTLSFYGSTFTSTVLDFDPVELTTNQVVDGRYPTLQKLSSSQQSVLDAYDRAPYTSEPGAIPFIDIGNRFVMIGASYSPTVLQGKSAAQIASALSHPSSPIAQAVDGTANLFVRAITEATGLHPTS
jgi:hypothetical protein